MNQLSEPHSIFDNGLLLDAILDYVIQEEGKVVTSQVKKCRRINKTWLQSVNRLLQKSAKPLFFFHVQEEGNSQYNNELFHGNELVKFMESVTKKNHLDLDHGVPLCSIRNSGCGAQSSACRILLDVLTNCGGGLIALDLRLSETQVPFPPNNNFSLPKLNRFTVELHRNCSFGGRDINDMQDKIDFMQAVFDASEQLKSLTLENGGIGDKIVPASFGNLLLAPSITYLHFRPPLKECHLQTLMNSSLPHLTTLKLCISKSAVESRLITSILKKIEKTLETLLLYYRGNGSENPVEGLTSYQVPLMKKLKTLYIANMHPSFELAERGSSSQQIVPVLNQLILYGQKKLRMWTENLCLPSVTILKISTLYHDDETDHLHFNRAVNIDLPNMQALHMAFPSVTKLQIKQVDGDMTALLYTMKNMTNLRCLRICFEEYGQLENSVIWDAVLTGIPKESVVAMRASPDLMEDFQVGSDVSIRNLTELDTLELYAEKRNFSGISEVAFRFGFLKMPKLTKLILEGGFWTTEEMAHIWKADGRFIQTNFD